MSDKYVYLFSEGSAAMRELLGGKGANLAEMTSIGLPVPPGFTITTEVCTYYYDARQQLARRPRGPGRRTPCARIEDDHRQEVRRPENPLLVSVRSGARVSMPGMMDTVLNLGLNDETVPGPDRAAPATSASPTTATAASSRCTATSCWAASRSPSDEHDPFEEILEALKKERGVGYDTELTADDLKELVARFKAARQASAPARTSPRTRRTSSGAPSAPSSAPGQRRAPSRTARMYDIPDDWGTAVNVQAMVFGNMGDDCGTGVAFTRDPATGENVFYGEYLINAQGEDVVAGIRTPQPIIELKGRLARDVYDELDGESARRSSATTTTCRTSSSRSRRASSRCSRPAPASAPASPRSASPSTWSTRASSRRTRRCMRVEPDAAQPAAAARSSTRRQGRRPQGGPDPRQGPQRRPRRGHRPGRLHRRRTRSHWARHAASRSSSSATETSPEDIGGMHAAEAS